MDYGSLFLVTTFISIIFIWNKIPLSIKIII